MGQQWYTSDLHLGHRLVSGLRGFEDTDEHDRAILGNLREALRPGDVLWCLGDLAVGSPTRAIDLLGALFEETGVTAHLIAGNHDACHPMHRKGYLHQQAYLTCFASVQPYQKMVWAGEDVWLSHFPRPGHDHEGMASRHDELRLDVPLLVHGHLHSDRPVTGPGMVDVGLDAWELRPVPRDRVQQTLFGAS
ncbi:MAG: metallophosphoesterase family protein [Corynebacterium nuruki]|nr:metallophosphoesterase family protein [Corynebacterium nuruki]